MPADHALASHSRADVRARGASRLQPFGESDLDEALPLLRRGFPERPEAFWLTGLARAQRRESDGTGWPLGYFLRIDDRAVGVMLTFAHRRERAGEREVAVNLSSWFVDPAVRILAPMMFRNVVRSGEGVLTELSPSESVKRMLPMLGFAPWNEGLVAVTAAEAMTGALAHAVVVPAERIPSDALSESDRRLLHDHDALGCVCAGLHDGATWHPLVFGRMKLKGVRAAYLIYAQSRRAVLAQRNAIAWFLLKRGFPLMCVDADRDDVAGKTLFFAGKRVKYLRGDRARDCVDYSYSELVFFGPENF
jgi:hypothetical protein